MLEVLTTWVSSSIEVDLAHGWPISIWLYICQINRFMNSVAPNFRVQCSVIKAFVEPKHNYETLIHDSEVCPRGAYRLLNENNVKLVARIILFAQKKIYYCRLDNTWRWCLSPDWYRANVKQSNTCEWPRGFNPYWWSSMVPGKELFSPKLKLHNMTNKTTRKLANPWPFSNKLQMNPTSQFVICNSSLMQPPGKLFHKWKHLGFVKVSKP